MCAVLLFLFGCSGVGSPPMEPLTPETLARAELRWRTHVADSYHLIVRVRPPRADVTLYDIKVSGGEIVKLERDGKPLRPEEVRHSDYSVAGLFGMLHQDLLLTDMTQTENAPPLDLRARFEPGTGRLVRYRRTVGSGRRRVLMVEVVKYEPLGA